MRSTVTKDSMKRATITQDSLRRAAGIPTSVCGVLEQAELVLAAGWSRDDVKKHGRRILGHSLVGAVYATNATPALKSEAVIFLNQHCADYLHIPARTTGDPAQVGSALVGRYRGLAVRVFNERLPHNDGKRRALLLIGEAVDAAKETLGK